MPRVKSMTIASLVSLGTRNISKSFAIFGSPMEYFDDVIKFYIFFASICPKYVKKVTLSSFNFPVIYYFCLKMSAGDLLGFKRLICNLIIPLFANKLFSGS